MSHESRDDERVEDGLLRLGRVYRFKESKNNSAIIARISELLANAADDGCQRPGKEYL
jgi:hypothetical protein